MKVTEEFLEQFGKNQLMKEAQEPFLL